MTDIFGQYQSQTTRQLAQINSTKYPDTNKDFEENIRRLNSFVDYISQYLQMMQKGVDQANQDIIGKIRDFGSNIAVLLAGGEIFNGMDLGDLQYMLPALGALLGFDSDVPFPINLFQAAEHFLLGYIVPLDAFTVAVEELVTSLLNTLGLDAESIASVVELIQALGGFAMSISDFISALFGLLNIFAIDTEGLGPFADLWHAISQLLSGLNLAALGDVLNPVFHTLAPWISELAQLLNNVSQIIEAFSGGLTDLQGVLNFATMFTGFIDFLDPLFDPVESLGSWILGALLPNGVLAAGHPIPAIDLSGNIPAEILSLIPVGAIRDILANFLPNPNFDTAASITDGGGLWSWANVVSALGVGHAVTATCDGTLKELYSDPATPCAPGDKIDVKHWLKWTGVTAIGNAFRLSVTFLDSTGAFLSDAILQTITSPAAASSNPSKNNYIELKGVSPITAPALAAFASSKLTIFPAATAGQTWWSNGSFGKPQLLDMDLVGDLTNTFQEIMQIFQGIGGQAGDIITAIGGAIKSWWDTFFNGGPKTVVSQDQIASPSGAAPTDGNNTIPFEYFPPEFTPVALGHPWTTLTKGDQTIPVTTTTKLSGWSQAGGIPLTIVSDTFKVPFSGLFEFELFIKWASFCQNYGKIYLVKNGTTFKLNNRYGSSLSIVDTNELTTKIPLDVTDTVEIRAEWNGSGSTKDVLGSETWCRITYIGATHLTATPIPTPTVTFDNSSGGAYGSGDISFTHVFGANSKTVVIPISHEASTTPVVTCGPYSVPVLSGPTYIGNYFGFNARYSLAAAILPDAVKGTSRLITIDNGSGNNACSANSMSFNGVSYLGAPKESSGSGTARLLVPSNNFSMVAGGFGGMDANFGSFNRTQTAIWNFIAGQTWSHVTGYALGGLEFTASAGKWAGKYIELHP